MEIKVYSKYGKEFIPVCVENESAGYDIISPEDVVLTESNPTYMLDLGIVLDGPQMEDGWHWCYKIIPRSSSSKMCLSFVNTIGVIDSSYRGPKDTLKVALQFNPPNGLFEKIYKNVIDYIGSAIKHKVFEYGFEIKKGDRIGQLVFQPIFKPTLIYSGTLEDHPGTTNRGGFGSTNN